MATLLQDLRYGLRMLAKNPGFTAVAVLTLALGIGANTAIFSVVNAVMLRPLPYPQPDRLVSIISTQLRKNSGDEASYPDFLDWRARNHVFDKMAVFRTENFALIGAGEPVHLSGAVVSAELFSLLGVTPILGRSFSLEEDKPGMVSGNNAVILSHGLWQRQFRSDPSVVGRTIDLDGRAYTVIGALPSGFQFPIQAEPVDLWTTMADDSKGGMATQRGAHYLYTIARLKPQVTLAQAQAEMSTIVTALNKEHPEIRPRGAHVVPALDHLVGEIRPALLVLFGAVGCVLLIVCANIANLLLARATTRQREMSIRAALGASRGRVIRQVLTESTLLACVGGSLGLLLAPWGTQTLIRLSPVNIPRLTQLNLDSRVFVFTTLVSLLTGLVFGLAPAAYGLKSDLAESLKEGARGSSEGAYRGCVRSALVVGEVAVALLLLVNAGLLLQSFFRLVRVDPGFDPHHVLTLRLDSPANYSGARQLDFFERVLEDVRALPGVRSASGVFGLPFSEIDAQTGFDIEGRPIAKADRPLTSYMAIKPDYFRTLGIPILEGRDFTLRDDLKASPVAIINETLARQFFPHQDPVGQRIQPGISNGYGGKKPMREIVGVVGDVKVHSLAAGPQAQCYVPLSQGPSGLMTVVVRTDTDPKTLVPAVRSTVAALDKNVPTYNIKTLDQSLSQSVAPPRFITLLLGIFAGLAMVLAAVGLYGLMAYSVVQRTHEIGVRMALGAERAHVLKLVVGQGLTLTLMGVAVGLGGALGLTRFLSSLLFGMKPTDPLTFAVASVLLTGVALLASYIPARRATKVDPMVALRYE